MEDIETDHIRFLGTAGSRFVVAKQVRSSAGIFIKYHGLDIIIDPGPGTLVKCAETNIDVTKLDAIILTHSHIDHSNDVNILIDAMTSGGLEKRGILFAPKEALDGDDRVILKYLRPFLEDIQILEEKKEYNIGDLHFSTSIRHLHPVETYGLKFNMNGRAISLMVDTKYFPELIDDYKDSNILIMNVTIKEPTRNKAVMHLCVEDVRAIISKVRPDQVILTHFGMTMLDAEPETIAQKIEEETKIDVMAGEDGMILDIS